MYNQHAKKTEPISGVKVVSVTDMPHHLVDTFYELADV